MRAQHGGVWRVLRHGMSSFITTLHNSGDRVTLDVTAVDRDSLDVGMLQLTIHRKRIARHRMRRLRILN